MKHISYPKIEQFRNIVSNINHIISFVGLDENGEAIHDYSIPKPTLTFTGTVKLHGTNAGVSYNDNDGFWAQSRGNIITPTHDNAGFAFFVESNKESFRHLMNCIIHEEDINTEEYTITIFGEWCGKSIQKGVGINNIEKSFFIFGVKISKPNDENFNSCWVDHDYLRAPNVRIYNITDYPMYSIVIDFNMPELSQNLLTKYTEEVEKQCPVAKEFGFEGVGEGIVWSTEYKGIIHRFKVKGEKHSISRVKTPKLYAPADAERLNTIEEFINYSVTENRFEQGIEKIFGNNKVDIRQLGDLIKEIINDIVTEEMDVMVKNSLEPKELNKFISNRVKDMFFKMSVI